MGRALRVGLWSPPAWRRWWNSERRRVRAGQPARRLTGAWMSAPPTNDAPNPYNTIEGWAKLPEGRTWGSTSAVDIDKDGKQHLGRRALRRSTRCWDRQDAADVAAQHRVQVRPERQDGDELRPGHVRVPARHPRRSRRQRLGDRRSEQPAAPRARARRPTRRCRRCRRRWSATRSSSSAPRAKCC